MTGIDARRQLDGSEAERQLVTDHVMRFLKSVAGGVVSRILDRFDLRDRVGVDQVDPEDAAIDAACRALVAVSEATQSLEALAYGILRNVIYERLRELGIAEELTEDIEAPGAVPGGSIGIEQATDDEKRLFVATVGAIGCLPNDQRIALLLHHHQCLAYQEVAERCGTTPGAIRQRVHRARWYIRNAIARDPVETDEAQSGFEAGTTGLLNAEVRLAQGALNEMIENLPGPTTLHVPQETITSPAPPVPEPTG